ncbi:protein SAWADEE HOMEODOMAIN HOMOLOG 2-like isoform X1 [Lycium barbarum]|uniref:protein SAWADEE HOMEODOMAIN HOMOLOG 2-like isoform X1 n=1 Tax=Lycium barbarum TaxID=112863 RepID=UPI00293F53A3|nr:protein SAWADEE HOMEODOMAIN HOMOLOG 2-like isoform X1 [Lycium barbarum]
MDLRPRKKQVESISGFTQTEIEKMENMLNESREQVCDPEICKKLAKMFTRSKGRAGKPVVKWTEVQAWFQNRLACCPSKDNSAEANQKLPDITEGSTLNKANESSHIPKGQQVPALSDLEFEARSSKDGAWYDIDTFISHRSLNSGEPEFLVRFVGSESEENEWVNVKKHVRERSVALEDSECNKVKVGDLVLCFQEGKNQSKYLEAQVIEIQKKLHDIRGCRCLFVIRYTHDDIEETVRLRRMCVRPSILGRP